MFDVSDGEITEGSIPRTLLVLAAPLVAQNLAMVAQQVVDAFWVGRLGEDAVAAIGLALPLTALAIIPVGAIFTGSQVLTAQRVGEEETTAATRVPIHAVALAVVASLAVVGVVWTFGDLIVAPLGASATVAGLATSYLAAWSLALLPTAVSDSLESGLIAWGDTASAFYVNVVALGVNVVVDPLFIFGWGPFPQWGLYGAGIATGVGWACGGVLALWFVTRGRGGYRLTRDSLRVEGVLFRRIVRVGSPIAVKRSGRQLARVGMVAIVSVVGGTAALAAYTIGARVSTVAFVPASGLGQATTSMVGQNVGAGQSGRAVATTWTGVAVGAAGLGAIGVGQWFVPELLARTFVPGIGGAALELSVTYLRILAVGYWAFGVIYVVEGGFNGAGRTDLSMAATLLQYWGVRLPVAAVGAFALGFGAVAAYWAVTVSNVVAAVGLAIYFRYSVADGLLERAVESASGETAQSG